MNLQTPPKRNLSSSSLASVLRKSGSSQCLQRSRQVSAARSFDKIHDNGNVNSNDDASSVDLPQPANTVTVINKTELPAYSTERYYMLSEIEMKARSIQFLCDWDETDATADDTHDTSPSSSVTGSDEGTEFFHLKTDTVADSVQDENQGSNFGHRSNSAAADTEEDTIMTSAASPGTKLQALPPCVILYLLWTPDSPHLTAVSYAEAVVYPTIRRIFEHSLDDQEVYQNCFAAHPTPSESYNNFNGSSPESTPIHSPSASPMAHRRLMHLNENSVLSLMNNNSLQNLSPMSPGNATTSAMPSWSERGFVVSPPKTPKKTRVYVVIDRLSPSSLRSSSPLLALLPPPFLEPVFTNDSKREEEQQRQRTNTEIEIAEALVKVIATAKHLHLRPIIDGVTVGVSSDARAAPGLESILEAVCLGDAERRRYVKNSFGKECVISSGSCSDVGSREGSSRIQFLDSIKEKGKSAGAQYDLQQPGGSIDMRYAGDKGDPARSCIGILVPYPDDLFGLDPSRETDAVQGLALHSRACAEWHGQGDVRSFAARAHKMWRRTWDRCGNSKDDGADVEGFDEVDQLLDNPLGVGIRRKGGHCNKKSISFGNETFDPDANDVATAMIACLFIFVFAHVWNRHGAVIKLMWTQLWILIDGEEYNS